MSNDFTPQVTAEDFPLAEPIVVHDSIAYFKSHVRKDNVTLDADFLKRLPSIEIWYGACDSPLFPFICVPKTPFTKIPTAKKVLAELQVSNFRSEHIKTLDTISIPFPGYKPGTDNDEIHTECAEQSIFLKPNEKSDDEELRQLSEDSLLWHQELKRYVLDKHIFYVLLHTKPHSQGEFEVRTTCRTGGLRKAPKRGRLAKG